MKPKIFKLILFIILISCSNKEEYYKKPIKLWLEQNLNDKESYEPIEYRIVDESFIKSYPKSQLISGDLPLAFSNLESSIAVKLNKLNKNSELKNFKLSSYKKLKNLIDSSQVSLNNYQKFLEINKQLNSEIKIENLLDSFSESEKKSLEFNNQIINKAHYKIKDCLSKLCLTENFKKTFNNETLIYHKFRSKNAYGGKIINNRLFKLNENKSEVIKSCLIK